MDNGPELMVDEWWWSQQGLASQMVPHNMVVDDAQRHALDDTRRMAMTVSGGMVAAGCEGAVRNATRGGEEQQVVNGLFERERERSRVRGGGREGTVYVLFCTASALKQTTDTSEAPDNLGTRDNLGNTH